MNPTDNLTRRHEVLDVLMDDLPAQAIRQVCDALTEPQREELGRLLTADQTTLHVLRQYLRDNLEGILRRMGAGDIDPTRTAALLYDKNPLKNAAEAVIHRALNEK